MNAFDTFLAGDCWPGFTLAGVVLEGLAAHAGSCWPGFAPAGEALFFASPKKSTQKKSEPNASPGTVCRYAALLGPGGVSLELGFASNNREP